MVDVINIGDHFWIPIEVLNTIEIAVCVGVDYSRPIEAGQYQFTYSHGNYLHSNFLDLESIQKFKMKPFSNTEYILYGKQ